MREKHGGTSRRTNFARGVKGEEREREDDIVIYSRSASFASDFANTMQSHSRVAERIRRKMGHAGFFSTYQAIQATNSSLSLGSVPSYTYRVSLG